MGEPSGIGGAHHCESVCRTIFGRGRKWFCKFVNYRRKFAYLMHTFNTFNEEKQRVISQYN